MNTRSLVRGSGWNFPVRWFAWTVLWLLGSLVPSGAVLFYSTAAPEHNTNAPSKTLTNSGWQYVGEWGDFSGTAISSNCFITAKHVGGAVGDPFRFHGTAYPTVACYEDPQTDLKLWRVDGVLTPYAPLYTRRNERNKGLVVIGRGTQRGEELRVNGVLKGWLWGETDWVQRWGRNIVTGISIGAAGQGELLRVGFHAHGLPDEAHLSGGDSGGAVFIKDGRLWKLAGVNLGVDGPFSTTNSGSGFMAALFDVGGMCVVSTNGWAPVRDVRANIPSSFYATRISSRTNWIASVLRQP